jgi:hypothetical protein
LIWESTNRCRGCDFNQSSFIADFTEIQQRRLFLGCSALASLRRVLLVARGACSTPLPRVCAESPPNAAFLSHFPTYKNNDLPTLKHLQRDLHRDTRTTFKRRCWLSVKSAMKKDLVKSHPRLWLVDAHSKNLPYVPESAFQVL